VICRFIAEHREAFGVVPICRVLTEHGCTIAPRTFYAWRSRPLSKRALWDATITAVLASYYVERDEHGRRRPESLYGSLKMWAHLRRQGIEVARCTNAVSLDVDTSQPTIVPANASMTNAVYAKPGTIRTYVKSAT
jgi:putative transposase